MARSNKYPATCAECGGKVAADAGLLGAKVDGRWTVVHVEGECGVNTTPASVAASTSFPPTAEQADIVSLFRKRESMVVVAGAGTGKTSTLCLIAEEADALGLKGLYVAFNKAIVTDVAGKLPKSTHASTAHALAYAAIVAGGEYADRLKNSRRMRPSEIARRIGIDTSFGLDNGDLILSVDRLAGIANSAISEFCKTTAVEPSYKHVPYIEGIDQPGPRGARTYKNNRKVAKFLEPALRRFWKDILRPTGQLQFKHEYYLKLWQLSHPKLDADFILFDECQDANPVMTAVINEQTHAQVVYVGDPQQQIYEFTGAINAIEGLPFERRFLSQSFRFGPAIAAAANAILAQIEGAELVLKGFDKIASVVGPIAGGEFDVDAILFRTNAAAVDTLLAAKQAGVKTHLVGKGTDVLAFARGVRDLNGKGFTSHPDLVAFSSWTEVKKYVAEEEQGAELGKLLHDLVEKYGVPTILDALEHMPEEHEADLCLSTAHKSKGREWNRVRIAADFVKQAKQGEKPQPPTASELRLRYVAVTRAKLALDHSALTGGNN